MTNPNDQLAKLIQQVQGSSKYQRVAPAIIERIGAEELSRRRSLKEAVKATKNKLHQSSAAYLNAAMPYPAWQAALAAASDEVARRDVLINIMGHHASSRERLPILDDFYQVLLAELPPLTSIIDVACGLNPLAIPWMGLTPETRYYAYDIYADMIGFLNAFRPYAGLQLCAEMQDAANFTPDQPADLALVLKTLPCLEQIDRKISLDLLQRLPARYMIVSFPAQSLGGRDKGMVLHYEAHFRTLLADQKDWTISRHLFETELAFIVTKPE